MRMAKMNTCCWAWTALSAAREPETPHDGLQFHSNGSGHNTSGQRQDVLGTSHIDLLGHHQTDKKEGLIRLLCMLRDP